MSVNPITKNSIHFNCKTSLLVLLSAKQFQSDMMKLPQLICSKFSNYIQKYHNILIKKNLIAMIKRQRRLSLSLFILFISIEH